MTRNVKHRPLLSKWVGILFSLGHGFVALIVSVLIGGGLIKSHIPSWLDALGEWISIVFLVFFGGLTLINVITESSGTAPSLRWQSYVFKNLMTNHISPLSIMLIGFLFACSFDTVSQVAFFSISASLMGGVIYAGWLGLLFMFGMMMSDGLNGRCVSWLILKTDNGSALISRGLGFCIALFSLSLGVYSLCTNLRS